MPQIKIHISPDGNVKIDAIGYEGKSCKEATRAIEEALGKVESDNLKLEYYLSAQAETQVKNGVRGG